jgi:hypothetical protein
MACTSLLGDFTINRESSADGGPGGDDGPSSSSSSGSSGGGPEAGHVMAVASNVSVYLGQPAKLDASASVPAVANGALAFQWALSNTPTGSTLVKGQISTTATASFVPDLPGSYSLTLTVSDPDNPANKDTTQVTVLATLPQVFFAEGTVGASGPSASYAVVDFDGGNPHPITCPITSMPAGAPNVLAVAAAYGSRIFDFWEAPSPAQPTEFAGLVPNYDPMSNTYAVHLLSGTAASACDAGLNDLDTLGAGALPNSASPHISPDGTRIVVYNQNRDIVTYGFDGGAVNTVATSQDYGVRTNKLDPSGVSSLPNDIPEPPRVEWMPHGSSTDLAWLVVGAGGAGWKILTAKDAPSAQLATLMTCTSGVMPRAFAVLSDQSVVVSYRATPTSGENLVLLKTGCVVAARYTMVGNTPSAIATDFAVSPDGSLVAFLLVDPSVQNASKWMVSGDPDAGQLPGGYVYLVSADGGTPVQVSPTPALYGPRWIGAGGSLVFTALRSLAAPLDASISPQLATSVVIVQPDGGAEHVVAAGDGVSTFVSTSGNAACSAVPGAAGRATGAGAAMVLLAGGLAGGLARRRRRGGRAPRLP